MNQKTRWIKLTQWEHWPTLAFYVPLLPFFIARFIRAGHPNHYLTANPGISFSGNGTESKFETLELLPKPFRPSGFLVHPEDSSQKVLERMEANGLQFPVIVKPNRGFRGYLVKKIETKKELLSYLDRVKIDLLIQEFIPHLNELGIFYHRIPGEPSGKITSVTIKRFLRVKGDGEQLLEELIRSDKRASLYFGLFEQIHGEQMKQVVEKDREVLLTVIGNHSKGTEFLNGNHLISKEMLGLMDELCRDIPGFYYGRLDIKYKDFDRLLRKEDFKILEINGIISEPTHIYDATHETASYWNALRCLNKHWSIMSEIAAVNHRKKGVPYPSVKTYLKNMLWLYRHSAKLKRLSTTQ